MKKYLFIYLIFWGGCLSMYSHDYDIEVRSASQLPLYGVLVESEKGMHIPFGTLMPGAGAYYAGQINYPFKDRFIISWSNQEKDNYDHIGKKPFTEVLDISSVSKDFKGVLQFKIDAQNKVSYKAIPYSEYYGMANPAILN